ncbi:hypothetical protein AVEN_48248-1 [Araneus ventricosus]|uniref:RNase H type-1 domain-containing protein n=1 Tax=Araneus ventricosus TaxID=182803 RepID=A0A4Y2IXJ5_ARAVE|nr:hypothetical protein AVEN_48248-1 [Araneus ventricosus]
MQAIIAVSAGRREFLLSLKDELRVYANTEDGLVFRCRFRNPDNCSVFRSELLAIREAMDFVLRFETSDTYILTDSKSSIQYLKHWTKIPEKNGQETISKIVSLSQKSRVCI